MGRLFDGRICEFKLCSNGFVATVLELEMVSGSWIITHCEIDNEMFKRSVSFSCSPDRSESKVILFG